MSMSSPEGEGELKIDAAMGVTAPQDPFLKHLYDTALHEYGGVVPTSEGLEISMPYFDGHQVVSITKQAETRGQVYQVKIPRVLLRHVENVAQNRVYVTRLHGLDPFFEVRAEDRDNDHQVIRIRCTRADFDWLVGAREFPPRDSEIRTQVRNLWALFNSLRDPISTHPRKIDLRH